MAGFRIRDAVVVDCEEIFRLSKELVDFHDFKGHIPSTVDTFRKDGFGENPLFRCHVAEKIDSGEMVGYTLFFPFYFSFLGKTMFMQELFVTRGSRGIGVGLALMKRLAQVCIEEDYARLQWETLSWNDKASAFYVNKLKAQDTALLDGGRKVFTLDKEGMKKL
ncbi:hypothetical protein SNE40_000096 [Patella caerulea]|uniref:N-acetyltransferase domain-containing protein n=1 Tax=Patella caerulea TaxID=87958 RepID=A0AAN8KD41_PATCE